MSARLVQTRHVGEYSPAKTGEYPRIFPNFQNRERCEKDMKNNKHNSLHLGRKYINNSPIWRENMLGYLSADIICSEWRTVCDCELQGTDNVQGQISEHIFAPNGGYCLYYPSNLLRHARSFENWGISSDIPRSSQFSESVLVATRNG